MTLFHAFLIVCGVLIGGALVIALVIGGNRKTPMEQAADDADQARKLANKPIRHVRAGSAWMGD